MTVLMGFVARPLAAGAGPATGDRRTRPIRRGGVLRLTVRVITLLLTGVVILRACSRLPVSAAPATAGSFHAGEVFTAAAAQRPVAKPTAPLPPGWRPVVGDRANPSVASRTVRLGPATVTLLRFGAGATRLVLHPVDGDPGSRKRMRAVVSATELPRLAAAFSGGFQLGDHAGAMALGTFQTGQLQPGLASVVTYSDGSTDVGAWGREVPAVGRSVLSVRQNLHLLIDKGLPANDLAEKSHWGVTFDRSLSVARSALGIDKDGNPIWAGSPDSTPRELAEVLSSVGVQRALELDINPAWVGAFTFVGGQQRSMMPGQQLPAGSFLIPRQRDFFSVDIR